MKNNWLILFLLCLFVNITVVLADGAGPEDIRYDAVVVAEKGATTYDWDSNQGKYVANGILDKGTTLTVSYTYTDENDVAWADVYIGSYSDSYMVKLSDIHAIDNSFDISDALPSNVRYQVMDAKKVVIKSGPANGFDDVKVNLKDGDVISSSYLYEHTWALVKIGDVSGWMYVYGSDSGVLSIIDDIVYTFYDVNIYNYDELNENYEPKVITTIPKGEELHVTLAEEGYYGNYYIEYNGKKGFVSPENFFKKVVKPIMILDGSQVYAGGDIEYHKLENKLDLGIENNTIFSEYYEETIYGVYDGDKIARLNYNGADIYVYDSNLAHSTSDYLTVNSEKGANIYSELKSKKNKDGYYYKVLSKDVIGTVDEHDYLDAKFSYYEIENGETYYYISAGGIKGWVSTKELETQGMDTPKVHETPLYNYNYDVEPTYGADAPVETPPANNPTINIILYFIGGIVVALTGVVIFVLINKKKKNKAPKVEAPVTTTPTDSNSGQ